MRRSSKNFNHVFNDPENPHDGFLLDFIDNIYYEKFKNFESLLKDAIYRFL